MRLFLALADVFLRISGCAWGGDFFDGLLCDTIVRCNVYVDDEILSYRDDYSVLYVRNRICTKIDHMQYVTSRLFT